MENITGGPTSVTLGSVYPGTTLQHKRFTPTPALLRTTNTSYVSPMPFNFTGAWRVGSMISVESR